MDVMNHGQTATRMNLADAMREADRLGLPDHRNDWIEENTTQWGGDLPPCCAIGGAAIAAGLVAIVPEGGLVPVDQYYALGDAQWHFVDIEDEAIVCPSCAEGNPEQIPLFMTMHLYDHHNWSRTQIADWLDSLEVQA